MFVKFLIITSQRTGSTFLRLSINSHSEVICEGEPLIGGPIPLPKILEDRRYPAKVYRYIKARAWNPTKILEDFFKRDDQKVLGCKAMYNHLRNKSVKNFLQQHTEIRIIHLRRDNLLKQYISKRLLGVKRRKRWEPHSTVKLPVVSVRINPDAAIKAMLHCKKQFNEFEELLSSHNKIEVIYEDMIDGKRLNDKTTKAICGLLDIEYRPLFCDLVKTNPNQLKLMIENYEDIKIALKNTEFERFLD